MECLEDASTSEYLPGGAKQLAVGAFRVDLEVTAEDGLRAFGGLCHTPEFNTYSPHSLRWTWMAPLFVESELAFPGPIFHFHVSGSECKDPN